MGVDPLAVYNPVMETQFYGEGQHNGGVYNSGNLNPYIYCYQNPILFLDPNGKQVVNGASKPNNILIVFGGGKDPGKLQNPNFAGTSGQMVLEAQKADPKLKYAVYTPGTTPADHSSLDMAVKFIKDNYTEGSKLAIYGYSHGGLKSTMLEERLKIEGYSPDLLITVDAAYGPISFIQDRGINNSRINVNEYQSDLGSVFSHGNLNINEGTGKVFNINADKLYNDVNHLNIDEKFKDYNAALLKILFSGGKSFNYNLNTNNSSNSNDESSSK